MVYKQLKGQEQCKTRKNKKGKRWYNKTTSVHNGTRETQHDNKSNNNKHYQYGTVLGGKEHKSGQTVKVHNTSQDNKKCPSHRANQCVDAVAHDKVQ